MRSLVLQDKVVFSDKGILDQPVLSRVRPLRNPS